MSTIRLAAFAPLALGYSAVLAQQSSVTEEAPAPPRYNVELVVFAHTDIDPAEERFESAVDPLGNATQSGGTPPPRSVIAIEPFGPQRPADTGFGVLQPGRAAESDPGTPPPAAIDGVSGGTGATGADSADPGPAGGAAATADDGLEMLDPFGTLVSRPPAPDGTEDPATSIRALGGDELTLGDATRIIDRLGAYRLLGHGGWQQAGLDEADAVPVDLARIGISNPTGTVKLYLGRFLHVALDLSYRAPTPDAALLPSTATGADLPAIGGSASLPAGSRPMLSEIPLPDRFRLHTERNAIRSGELHYIDHPRFGVLIRITPAPEPEDEEAEAAGDAPSA